MTNNQEKDTILDNNLTRISNAQDALYDAYLNLINDCINYDIQVNVHMVDDYIENVKNLRTEGGCFKGDDGEGDEYFWYLSDILNINTNYEKQTVTLIMDGDA